MQTSQCCEGPTWEQWGNIIGDQTQVSVSAYVVCVCVHTCVFQGEVAKEAFPGKTVFELRPIESKREKNRYCHYFYPFTHITSSWQK